MRTYTVQKPVGTDPETDFAHRQHRRNQEELQLFDSTTIKIERTTRGIRFHAKIPPASAGSTPLSFKNYPISTDLPGFTAKAGEWFLVQKSNDLLTVGVTDPDSGETVYATAGKWLCIRDAAPVDAGGTPKYHIPHLPMPTDDDAEAADNYFIFFGGGDACFT